MFDRDMLSFVSPGVIGEYVKSLFSSLHSFSPRILRICLTISAHSKTILCTANNIMLAEYA